MESVSGFSLGSYSDTSSASFPCIMKYHGLCFQNKTPKTVNLPNYKLAVSRFLSMDYF